MRKEKLMINIYDHYEYMFCEFEDEAQGKSMENKEVSF
ncbi:hypothetical protein BCD91_003092 [Clostridium beijerinckii]|nr:hypothetical protein [Clostridium beijerinckii]